MGNREVTIQRKWRHLVPKTHDEDIQKKPQKNQNTTQKKKDEQHGPYQIPWVNPCAREWKAVPTS